MVSKFLIIDDLGSRTEDVVTAAAPLAGHVTITPVSRIHKLLEDFDPARLAEYDVIAVDAHLSSDRKTSPGSAYEFVEPDQPGRIAPLQISTGLGVMKWVTSIQTDPIYREARISLHGPLRGQKDGVLFSFMDITEPHSRFFAPAAFTCFGAELLPATAEIATITQQLTLVAATADGSAAVRNNQNSKKVRELAPGLDSLLNSPIHVPGARGSACLYDWMSLVKLARTDTKLFQRLAGERFGVDVRWRGAADYKAFREALSRKLERYLKPVRPEGWVTNHLDSALLSALESDKDFWSADDVRYCLFARGLAANPTPA